jgi:hypothetical protein
MIPMIRTVYLTRLQKCLISCIGLTEIIRPGLNFFPEFKHVSLLLKGSN